MVSVIIGTFITSIIGMVADTLIAKIKEVIQFKWNLKRLKSSLKKRLEYILKSEVLDIEGYIVRLLEISSLEIIKDQAELKTRMKNKIQNLDIWSEFQTTIKKMEDIFNQGITYLKIHIIEKRFTIDFFNAIFRPLNYTEGDAVIIKLIHREFNDVFLDLIKDRYVIREILFITNVTDAKIDDLREFLQDKLNLLHEKLESEPDLDTSALVEELKPEIESVFRNAGVTEKLEGISLVMNNFLISTTELLEHTNNKFDDLMDELKDLTAEINTVKVILTHCCKKEINISPDEFISFIPKGSLEPTHPGRPKEKVMNDLGQAIVQFLNKYDKWWFSSARMKNWGSNTSPEFSILRDKDLKFKLEELSAYGIIRKKPSKKGNWNLYKSK